MNDFWQNPNISWISGMWALWGLYWLISATRTKSTRRSESSATRFSYLLPTIAGLVLFARNQFGPLSQIVVPQDSATLQFAIALVAAGLAFSIWARWHLGSNWSASVTIKDHHNLIRTEPYAWVRHPIYTGMLAGGIGTAIAVGKLNAFLGLALMVVGFIRKMQIEEQWMQETFGEQYEKYKAEVWALIPYVY